MIKKYNLDDYDNEEGDIKEGALASTDGCLGLLCSGLGSGSSALRHTPSATSQHLRALAAATAVQSGVSGHRS